MEILINPVQNWSMLSIGITFSLNSTNFKLIWCCSNCNILWFSLIWKKSFESWILNTLIHLPSFKKGHLFFVLYDCLRPRWIIAKEVLFNSLSLSVEQIFRAIEFRADDHDPIYLHKCLATLLNITIIIIILIAIIM